MGTSKEGGVPNDENIAKIRPSVNTGTMSGRGLQKLAWKIPTWKLPERRRVRPSALERSGREWQPIEHGETDD
jgi:hypothetical protein